MSTLLCFPDSAAFCIFLTVLHSCLPLPTNTFLCYSLSQQRSCVMGCTLNTHRHVHGARFPDWQSPGSHWIRISSSEKLFSTVLFGTPLWIPAPQGGSRFLQKYHCFCGLNTSRTILRTIIMALWIHNATVEPKLLFSMWHIFPSLELKNRQSLTLFKYYNLKEGFMLTAQ